MAASKIDWCNSSGCDTKTVRSGASSAPVQIIFMTFDSFLSPFARLGLLCKSSLSSSKSVPLSLLSLLAWAPSLGFLSGASIWLVLSAMLASGTLVLSLVVFMLLLMVCTCSSLLAGVDLAYGLVAGPLAAIANLTHSGMFVCWFISGVVAWVDSAGLDGNPVFAAANLVCSDKFVCLCTSGLAAWVGATVFPATASAFVRSQIPWLVCMDFTKGLVVLASAVDLVAVLFVIVSNMVQLFAGVADAVHSFIVCSVGVFFELVIIKAIPLSTSLSVNKVDVVNFPSHTNTYVCGNTVVGGIAIVVALVFVIITVVVGVKVASSIVDDLIFAITLVSMIGHFSGVFTVVHPVITALIIDLFRAMIGRG
jgi:hypothetical protein